MNTQKFQFSFIISWNVTLSTWPYTSAYPLHIIVAFGEEWKFPLCSSIWKWRCPPKVDDFRITVTALEIEVYKTWKQCMAPADRLALWKKPAWWKRFMKSLDIVWWCQEKKKVTLACDYADNQAEWPSTYFWLEIRWWNWQTQDESQSGALEWHHKWAKLTWISLWSILRESEYFWSRKTKPKYTM